MYYNILGGGTMNEEQLSKLKGIAAMLEYMASAERLDVKYTQDALYIVTSELNVIIEEVEEYM